MKHELNFNFEQGSARKMSGAFGPRGVEIEFDYHSEHPLVRLLARALYCYMQVDFLFSRRVITNIVDAFSSLYSSAPMLRARIVSELHGVN